MTERENIRILIADDHAIVREGLRTLITAKPGLELVGEAADGEEAIALARLVSPDVILLDMIMPRKDGLEAIKIIKRENPQARILVLTSFSDDDKVFAAIKAGALGYLLKDSSPQQLIQAIRSVYQGQPEVDTLRLVAQGLTNQEIADKLSISERTVGKHVSNILDKLHLANRTQAALYAIREGLVDPNRPASAT